MRTRPGAHGSSARLEERTHPLRPGPPGRATYSRGGGSFGQVVRGRGAGPREMTYALVTLDGHPSTLANTALRAVGPGLDKGYTLKRR